MHDFMNIIIYTQKNLMESVHKLTSKYICKLNHLNMFFIIHNIFYFYCIIIIIYVIYKNIEFSKNC